jgi:hypothetical protein
VNLELKTVAKYQHSPPTTLKEIFQPISGAYGLAIIGKKFKKDSFFVCAYRADGELKDLSDEDIQWLSENIERL